MIDKIEIIPEPGKAFGRAFAPIERELRSNPRFANFRPGKHYMSEGDLRPFGFDAIMHLDQRRYHSNKLELLDTGKKKLDQLCATVEDLIAGDPLDHRVSRIDLCADVPGVPIPWFRDHTRVRRKQWLADFSEERIEIDRQQMGKKFYQTLYWGKRPCCLRIYDKVGEMELQYRRLCRRIKKEDREAWAEKYDQASDQERADLIAALPIDDQGNPQPLETELPEFREWLASELPISKDQQYITRVENQMGGGRVPEKLANLQLVKFNAKNFNPFEGLDLMIGPGREPDHQAKTPEGKWLYSPLQFMAGMYLREHWSELGATQIYNLMNRDRNGERLRELLLDFFPDDGGGLSIGEIQDRYQATVTEQLAA